MKRARRAIWAPRSYPSTPVHDYQSSRAPSAPCNRVGLRRVQVRSDEVNAFPLIGWRETSAAASAHHAATGQLHAAISARSQHGAALERAHCFPTQQARQLDPLRPPDARTPFYKFCRHCLSPYRPGRGPAVRHLPTVPRTLVPGPHGNSSVPRAVNSHRVRPALSVHAACAAAKNSSAKGRPSTFP